MLNELRRENRVDCSQALFAKILGSVGLYDFKVLRPKPRDQRGVYLNSDSRDSLFSKQFQEFAPSATEVHHTAATREERQVCLLTFGNKLFRAAEKVSESKCVSRRSV